MAAYLADVQQLLLKASQQPATTALTALLLGVGTLTAAKAVLGLLYAVYKYFLRPGINLKRLGSWAVVTGATDGIGKAYCQQLAKKGINIVLISRTQAKLDEEAAALQAKYRVQTKTVAVDFAAATDATWKHVSEALAGLEVGVLVNNVGVSYDHAEFFDQVDDDLIRRLIQVNVTALTQMCRIVVPGMKARKRGCIVNIGSGSGTIVPASPLLAVYAGTKAYVDALSRAMNLEYAAAGIRVQNQAPLFVATKLAKIRRPRLDAPSPAVYAAAGVRHIGREATSCPYWVHALMWWAIAGLPEWAVNAQVLAMHLKLRKAYYRKQERLAKGQ